MRTSSNDIGIPAGEPKDGDFVAYLAQIEKRQLAALPVRSAHAPPALTSAQTPRTDDRQHWADRTPLSASEAERVRQPLKSDSGDGKGLVAAALMGLFGLIFTVQGLVGDGGLIAVLIGVFLLWRAWVSLRTSLRAMSPAQRDLAARLADSLRQSQHRK